MILVCAPSPFRVHSHCRHCAAAAPAATPTPGPWADDADAAAAAQAAPSSSSPPRTATSGRRGLCRRRAVVVRLSFPPSNTTVRDDPALSPPSPALLLSSPLLPCVRVGSSPLAHSVLPDPPWSSGGGVTLCGVTGGVCVVSRRPPPARGATPSSPAALFLWHSFVVFPVGRYSLLPPPLIAGSLFRCRPRPTPAIAALLPKVLRPLFVLVSRGLVRCTREVRGCRAFSVLL